MYAESELSMDRKSSILLSFMMVLVVSGCAALLPRSSSISNSPWKTYKDVVTAYDKVIPNRSTITEIRKLGFDIYSTANLKILSYVDVAVATQSLKKGELSSGIEACLKVQTLCTGYAFEPQVVNSKRYGNFWMDTFNFKRKIKETGWRAKASFLIIDTVVVDKYWSGEPQVDYDKETVNPLGPLQDVGNIFTGSKYNPL
jgi:hypothetical protein